jgi:hypothetical protein
VTLSVAPKTGTRGAFETRDRPFKAEHERSTAARWDRHPQRLRDLVRELHEARESEMGTIARLHGGGVEWEPMVEGEYYGGSKLGTPRWDARFRRYITGPDCETTEDGDWRWPLRSSLFRLSISRSGTDRLAAAFCWLLIHHRYNVREAWAAQCGVLADPAIADAAEAWASEALGRWWKRYVEQPLGRPIA